MATLNDFLSKVRQSGQKRVTIALCQSQACASRVLEKEVELERLKVLYENTQNELERKRLYRRICATKNLERLKLDNGSMVFMGIVGEDISRNQEICPVCGECYLYFKTIVLEPSVTEDIRMFMEERSLPVFGRVFA